MNISAPVILFFAAVLAQQTADNERTGWYASNPWMLAALLLPLLALIAAGPSSSCAGGSKASEGRQ